MNTTFEFPYIIGTMIVNKNKVISNEQRLARMDIINVLNQAYYRKAYQLDHESSIVYYDKYTNSNYPLYSIGNLIGVEPVPTPPNTKNDTSFYNAFLILPHENDVSKDRLIILGNAILRANIGLPNLSEFALENDYDTMIRQFQDNDHYIIRIVKSLASLYSQLFSKTNELQCVSNMYSPFNDSKCNNFLYILTYAMAIATLENAYKLMIDEFDVSAENAKDAAFEKLFKIITAQAVYHSKNEILKENNKAKAKLDYMKTLKSMEQFFLAEDVQYMRVGQIISNLLSRIKT